MNCTRAAGEPAGHRLCRSTASPRGGTASAASRASANGVPALHAAAADRPERTAAPPTPASTPTPLAEAAEAAAETFAASPGSAVSWASGPTQPGWQAVGEDRQYSHAAAVPAPPLAEFCATPRSAAHTSGPPPHCLGGSGFRTSEETAIAFRRQSEGGCTAAKARVRWSSSGVCAAASACRQRFRSPGEPASSYRAAAAAQPSSAVRPPCDGDAQSPRTAAFSAAPTTPASASLPPTPPPAPPGYKVAGHGTQGVPGWLETHSGCQVQEWRAQYIVCVLPGPRCRRAFLGGGGLLRVHPLAARPDASAAEGDRPDARAGLRDGSSQGFDRTGQDGAQLPGKLRVARGAAARHERQHLPPPPAAASVTQARRRVHPARGGGSVAHGSSQASRL